MFVWYDLDQCCRHVVLLEIEVMKLIASLVLLVSVLVSTY